MNPQVTTTGAISPSILSLAAPLATSPALRSSRSFVQPKPEVVEDGTTAVAELERQEALEFLHHLVMSD
jgi:hypothetical protein